MTERDISAHSKILKELPANWPSQIVPPTLEEVEQVIRERNTRQLRKRLRKPLRSRGLTDDVRMII